MNHGSLFSGIGGFDLAAEWMGWNNAFHCEWNQFGRKVLNHYWPNSISYEDITKTDFSIHRGRIDILTGGFPCQPYSMAGKRLGKDDERHLWPEMLRAIRQISPRWVVGENVFGLVNWNGGMVFDEVQADLEAQGYEVQPFVLPACAVNAPHRRDRVWFVAFNSKGNRNAKVGSVFKGKDNESLGVCSKNNERIPADNGETWPVADTDSRKCEERSNFDAEWQNEAQNTAGVDDRFTRLSIDRPTPDTSNQGLQGSEVNGSIGASGPKPHKQPSRFIQPTWQNFPTQSPICSGDDGLPSQLDGITFPKWRNESIKAYGNAIVPQVVLQIFKAIEAYEQQIKDGSIKGF
jgi:DNA (cytosine-5)-methyltransferase 1